MPRLTSSIISLYYSSQPQSEGVGAGAVLDSNELEAGGAGGAGGATARQPVGRAAGPGGPGARPAAQPLMKSLVLAGVVAASL